MTAHVRERGFALVIVLWAVVLLASLAAGLLSSGRADVQLAANLRDAAIAEAAADGAIFEAALHLLDPASGWIADQTDHGIVAPGARVTVRIGNEAGKINPNGAQPGLLAALLVETGVDVQNAERLAQSIVEWRFPRDQVRFSDGQPTEYRNAGLSYGPPGAPFESVAELGQVVGMTPAILARVEPHLSILTDAPPDPAVADAVVLGALRRVGAATAGQRTQPRAPRLVDIAATAVTASGSRFVRRAVVLLGATEKEPPASVLAWRGGDG